jgi:hypothetical protein
MLRQMERSTIQYLVKRGVSQRQIAKDLGRNRATIARVLREPIDRRPAPRRRRSQVDPYRPQIEQWIAAGLSAVRMLELAWADAEQPYTGSRSQFGEMVRRIRQEQQHQQAVAEVPIRFEGLPGELSWLPSSSARARYALQERPRATPRRRAERKGSDHDGL